MILKKFLRRRQDGIELYKTYSDNNVKIRKVGTQELYDFAIDVETTPFKYEETDIPVSTKQ